MSLITHILFELWLIMIFSPVANFAQQSLSLYKDKPDDLKLPCMILGPFIRKTLIKQAINSVLETTFLFPSDLLND